MATPAAPGTRLYVANLGETMGESWLQERFAAFGTVQKVFVMNDRKSQRGRYSAFVTYEDPAVASQAIAALNKSDCPDGDAGGLIVKYVCGVAWQCGTRLLRGHT
eukprot:TRINITY_DN11233_c0_g1_i1.p2 TRINITY_DN11233_c0_g1~~TRINITY_DN11233_c0_g1_i1.p2  ORF type:complete len:121 (+),score=34.22 TRINITY_DN11233_c0_g1_i1:50-364(+)